MKGIGISLLFIFAASQVTSQQLQVTNYSQKGVPVYGVNSIFQDSKGWMWFTSGYEVIRYDGYQFKTLYPAAGNSMNFCFQVYEVEGELWVNADPYLLKIRDDSLYRFETGDREKGLDLIYHLRHADHSFFLGRKGLYELKNGNFESFITDTSLKIIQTELLIPYNDTLLISYKTNRSLIAFDIKNRKYHFLDLPVMEMKKDAKGIYMLLAGQGIFRINELVVGQNGLNIHSTPVRLLDGIQYSRFVMDGQDNFWTYQQFNGLIKILPDNSTRSYTEANGLPSLWFTKLFVDREKNIWIGFNGGLCKILHTNWERYTVAESLYSNHILFMTNGAEAGSMFVGTQNGLNIFEKNSVHKVVNGVNAFSCNYMISGDGETRYYLRDSNLYSCTIGPGYQVRSEKKLTQLPGATVKMIRDTEKDIYICTTKGLFAWSKGQLIRLIPDSSYYRDIFIDEKSRLWAGEFAGILHCYQLEKNNGEPQLRKLFEIDTIGKNILPIRAIRSLAVDKKENIFIGTRYNGLFLLRIANDRPILIKHLMEKDGMASNTVWSIAVDHDGTCWVANMKGLVRLKEENGSWKIVDEGTKRQLRYAILVTIGDDNTAWIANHPGLTVIRKGQSIESKPFSVLISEINANGKPVGPASFKRFNYRNNNINIIFSANSYRQEELILYSWRLKDDDNWTAPAPVHEVNYSALGPGKYHFSVKAIDAEGMNSINQESFAFQVLPPFWQQAWFIILAGIIIAGGLFLLYRYRVKRIKELYAMRTSIARDLHDEIGSTLTSINVLSKVSYGNLKKDHDKAGQLLEKVIEQSQQIQQNMSDIVWAIKPDNDTLQNMTVRRREYISHTLEPHDIHIDFNADETIMEKSLDMQQRRDFFLIFKEAINNIAKYSKCRTTTILLTKKHDQICLQVKDDGIGFDRSKQHPLGGLLNMERRALLLKGTLVISSSPGKGTLIELLVPAT